MGFTNSSLVSYTKLTKHHGGRRTHAIDRITPHCVVGQWTAKTIGDYFYSTDRNASCNYGIGKDGKIALCVEEKNKSWCSSSSVNDNRAVTIECASDTTHPYKFTEATFTALVDLCVDICKRNGKTKLLWFGDKNKALNYSPRSNEMVLTVHRWFKAKACPGDWLMQRMNILADTVTQRLNKPVIPPAKPKEDKEMVDKTKVLLNGKEVEVTRIIKDGVNYVKLRDIDSVLGLCTVGYDDKLKMPIITTK